MRLVVMGLDDIWLRFFRDFPYLLAHVGVITKPLADDVQVGAGVTHGIGKGAVVRSCVSREGGNRDSKASFRTLWRTQPAAKADEVLGRSGDRVRFHHREYPQSWRFFHAGGSLIRLR